jgi:PAS domain-containing protein
MTFNSLALELIILLALWLGLGVWQKDRATPGRKLFLALALSAAAWCFGDLSAERNLLGPVASYRIGNLGMLSLPALWLGVAAHVARLNVARRVPWFPLLLMAPQAVLYALLYAGPWGHLFLDTTGAAGADLHGPMWWLNATYSHLLWVTGSGLVVYAGVRDAPAGGLTLRLVIAGACLAPLAGNAAHLANGMAWQHDPTPLLFGVALLALHSALFSGGLLQALPISQHDLIGQLPVGVVLTDRRGVVVDVNPTAERHLGQSLKEALGRTLDAVLDDRGETVLIEVTPILSGGRESGQLVLIDPPSKV